MTASLLGAVNAALARLGQGLMTLDEAFGGGVPTAPGLYALYGSLSAWAALGLDEARDRPLYVGKAEADLVKRDLRTHFATGRTGQSSPRRSFAALLRRAGTLDLVARPRRWPDPEPTRWTHFALDDPSEEELTTWMCRELKIAVWPSPPRIPLPLVEREVIRAWVPPLNLTGPRTHGMTMVREERAAMALEARGWARGRTNV